jgi:hypothetical protein
LFVPAAYGRGFRGRHYDRPTFGVWQVGGPCYIAISEPWHPRPSPGATTPEDLLRITDEIMNRVLSALSRARAMAA